MPSRNQYKTNEEYNEYFRIYRELNQDKMNAYNREYNRKWRKENGYHNEINSKLRYPEKEKARRILQVAVRAGKILKSPCLCGNPKSQAHHGDYSLPLEVVWLCPRCHSKEHKKEKNNSKQQISNTKAFSLYQEKMIEFKKLQAKQKKRRVKILSLRKKGLSLRKIAIKVGVTYQRIGQICKNMVK